MNKSSWLFAAGFLIVQDAIMAFVSWPFLPNSMATHWNFAGVADGYSPKYFAVLFLPLLSLGTFYLLLLLPRFVPQSGLDKQGKKTYHQFIFAQSLFFWWIYLLSIWWNLGHSFDFTQLLVPAFGILFYSLAQLLSKVERNTLIGIRSPWTIQDDQVWEAVHARARTVFLVIALGTWLSLLLPSGSFVGVILLSFLAAFGLLIYSAVLFYQKHGHL